MPFGSGGSGGGALEVPLDVVSSPVGTDFSVNEFGRLQVVGTNGNTGSIQVQDTSRPGVVAVLTTSGLGVYTQLAPVIVADVLGNTLGTIALDGTLGTLAHAAPADADLADGEARLWLDQTNGVGNTKLMVKAKSADGTVKTAAIVLA